MNHKLRAKGIVGRAFPKIVHTNDGQSVDVSAWHEDLVKAIAKGLRQAERDARAEAVKDAARFVWGLGLGDRALNKKICDGILELEKAP